MVSPELMKLNRVPFAPDTLSALQSQQPLATALIADDDVVCVLLYMWTERTCSKGAEQMHNNAPTRSDEPHRRTNDLESVPKGGSRT